MNRRQFLRTAGAGFAASATATIAAAGYGMAESTQLVVTRPTLRIPNLPSGFAGTRVAFVTDLHHGPRVSLETVASIVRTTLALEPDLIVLGGDYTSADAKYVGPAFDLLKLLRAPLGVYGVLGNHDYHGTTLAPTKAALARSHIAELTNRNTRITRRGESLVLAGVDDLWHGRIDLGAALSGVKPGDACVLLSHNPDVAETLTDPRVGHVLSGHTHGGQVVIPGLGAVFTPSRYGQKYARGLVQAPRVPVYVSAGTGMSAVSVRTFCPPEIALLTLEAA